MSDKPATNDIDTPAAAALLKLSPRRLQQLAKDGWITASGRGKWPLVGVVQGYIEFLTDENRRAARSAGDSDSKRARAREIELRIAKEDRRVIDLEEALEVVSRLAGIFNQSIAGLPARITRDARERQRLQTICDAEKRRVSDVLAKGANAMTTGVPFDEADGKEDLP